MKFALLVVLLTIVGAVSTHARVPRKDRPPARESWPVPAKLANPQLCEDDRDWYSYSKDAKQDAIRKCRLLANFDALVLEHQGCDQSTDCLLLQTDCLFNCGGLPVARSGVSAVRTKIAELSKLLAKELGARCRCVDSAATHSVCIEGRCLAARRN
jgi:hypothetical protein